MLRLGLARPDTFTAWPAKPPLWFPEAIKPIRRLAALMAVIIACVGIISLQNPLALERSACRPLAQRPAVPRGLDLDCAGGIIAGRWRPPLNAPLLAMRTHQFAWLGFAFVSN